MLFAHPMQNVHNEHIISIQISLNEVNIYQRMSNKIENMNDSFMETTKIEKCWSFEVKCLPHFCPCFKHFLHNYIVGFGEIRTWIIREDFYHHLGPTVKD